ncbi:MAG: BrnT family toxin [Acidobacteria bacterium]|nr:BrnT family toxin [Acidobacteriota bacterium]
MKITGFIWLDDIVQKLLWKHTVTQKEVAEIFADTPRFRFVEKGHRSGENVYSAFGQTGGGRYLAIFFVYKKDGRALILSARDMTDSERRRHAKK